MKKRLVFGVLSLLTASLLISQSVVDASKQEQERREKNKGKSVKVVTNADLKAKARTPAAVVGAPEAAKAQTEGQAEPQPEQGAAAGEEAQPEQPPAEPEYSVRYAASVYPEWFLVENPDLALGAPDGRFAEVSVGGVLDLDIDVNNGPGDDLAIYARTPTWMIPDEERGNWNQLDNFLMPMLGQEGIPIYSVLALDGRGEWQGIGVGSGKSPDKLDLGTIESTRRIRIMFRSHSNPLNTGEKQVRLAGGDLTFGLDSVGALH